ncbi:MAG: SsrA-binding protein SmpB [Clostridia bacterium]|nr:SsrA-binding protein SmpB [Clostridia bacterium]
MSDKKNENRTLAENRKARHDYFVEEVFEAGIALCGTEVKSVRAGACNLKDSYCDLKDGELYAVGIHISPYEHGNIFNREPMRDRKLLLHKREIMKLVGLVTREGYTLIPLSLYLKGSNVKAAIGLCKGKHSYDKREDIAKRDADRLIERHMKDGGKNYD